jgi:hypothetical protein
MVELGVLKSVDVRQVWKHEASDFSQWLSRDENIKLLGETVKLDLQVDGTEVYAGKFRIDILATDLNTDHKVIIENQLEPSNHDHLGKVITYAAALDAKYLIWIVKDVLPEHQKAIEWLNEFLDEEIRIFLLRIEVWQIGNSAYAPNFEIVSAKNDWAAAVKRSATSGEVSETKLKQQQFWAELVEYIRSKDSNIRLHSPLPQHWLNFSIGSAIANVVATINTRDSRFTTDLYITKDKAFKEFLEAQSEKIAKDLNEEISWWEGDKASGFRIRREVSDVFDSSTKEENMEWIYKTVIKLKKVIAPYIQEYRQNSAE